jgi:hypothetical protein
MADAQLRRAGEPQHALTIKDKPECRNTIGA